MSYKSWIQKQNDLVEKAVSVIRRFDFKCFVVGRGKNKPKFIRLFLSDQSVDFFVKEVKSRWSKEVWLCKKQDFNPSRHCILHLEKENKFLVCSGEDARREGKLRDSDFHKGVKFLVVPMKIFRGLEGWLRYERKRTDKRRQRKIKEWT